MDIERLLSPTGGYNYSETINSGVTGLGMTFMSGSLFDSFIMRPAKSYMQKQLGVRYQTHPYVKATDLNLGQRVISRLDSPASYPPGSRYNTSEPEITRGSKEQIEAANEARRKGVKKALRAEYKDWKSKFSKGRNVFKAAGWATLISMGVDLATEASTPGVSKVAARQDEKFMMQQQRMDSPAAFTMRQRAIEAIHNSMMSTRNVMGNEAQFMHR